MVVPILKETDALAWCFSLARLYLPNMQFVWQSIQIRYHKRRGNKEEAWKGLPFKLCSKSQPDEEEEEEEELERLCKALDELTFQLNVLG